MEGVIREGRSLEETPTWSVATVTSVMVFVCLFMERSIYKFGKWLKRTRRKALYASLEKIKEELMLLGLISLLLGQSARWISQICVNSSLFNSRFYLCSEEDYHSTEKITLMKSEVFSNVTEIPKGIIYTPHHCGEGREPFVSYEGLEQLHRFLFVLGITHVLYSCITVGLSMSKIYSWRKFESQIYSVDGNMHATKTKVMRRQSTFAMHHAAHPWSRSRILIWMLCFFRQFRTTIQKSDYLALRLGFLTKHRLPLSYNFHKYMIRSMEDEFSKIVGISRPLWGYAILCIFVNIHGLNIYFWLSFIPVIIVMAVGTKLQHVVSILALEILEPRGPSTEDQVKPRDDLFWFGKPEILLRLIQFISFQVVLFQRMLLRWLPFSGPCGSQAARVFHEQPCYDCHPAGFWFWCSYSTVPLNVIISQMGSRCRKALIAESVRDSLHSWCKRVKERSKSRRDGRSITTRSTCSLGSTIDENDETITVGSGTLSRSSSLGSLHQVDINVSLTEQQDCDIQTTDSPEDMHELSFRILDDDSLHPPGRNVEGDKEYETLVDLFHKSDRT